ncbi:emerin (Emery-Dreifuss muscular dystrophy) isoform X1 [Oreochromis niloticus]|uniref:emerin (Emery-Dreifuss muscular dystrophy) isoform X1 n=2 Tax=Oreochromis niloticus TaxID=8128 RepID=UPI000904AF0A|nr:uncharacterized protein LOC100701763 isoform X1 [Oreochromis niloticus]CAI5678706.1 unnamed protein product [Mustela putorius furo]
MENVYHVTQIADDKGPVGSALSADYSIKTKALVTVLQNEARLAGSAVICGCANLTSPNSGEVTPTCELYCCAQLSFVSVHAAQPSSYSKGWSAGWRMSESVCLQMSLSEKSDEELGNLLSQYGIKHGPIVGSTRHLYESKLGKAMEQASVKTSSDKTYYREEEEEVTYITYHSAATRKRSANTKPERADRCCLPRCQSVLTCRVKRSTEQHGVERPDADTEAAVQVTYSSTNHTSVRSGEPTGDKSTGSLWKMILVLLPLAVLSAVCYYAYAYIV